MSKIDFFNVTKCNSFWTNNTKKKKPETVGCKEKGQILDPISVNATFIKKWKFFSKSKKGWEHW